MKDVVEYRRQNLYRKLFIIVGLLACVCTFVVDMVTGPSGITWIDIYNSIARPDMVSAQNEVIIWSLRMPMALMALLVGGALGVAGASMQTILNNPLASPYTLGVSAGASFGASFAVVIGISTWVNLGNYGVPFLAFVFSMIASFLIYFISRLKSFSSETMVLAGIGLLFLFQALQALMQYFASPEALQNIVFWTLGSLTKANWTNIPIIAVVLCVFTPLILRESWNLTALKLGDEKAKGLGIQVESLRVRMFVYISLLTSVAVSFVGTIGFIGIVGPHIARMLVGEDQRYFIPMSAVSGMFMLSVASILTKVIKSGAIFPIGIVTAIIGVPFFFSLILTQRKRYFSC